MDGQTKADLLETINDRASHRATIITSQLPIERLHEWFGDQRLLDAMLDRLMQSHCKTAGPWFCPTDGRARGYLGLNGA